MWNFNNLNIVEDVYWYQIKYYAWQIWADIKKGLDGTIVRFRFYWSYEGKRQNAWAVLICKGKTCTDLIMRLYEPDCLQSKQKNLGTRLSLLKSKKLKNELNCLSCQMQGKRNWNYKM